jgi:DNA repair protein Swi5/Sae3
MRRHIRLLHEYNDVRDVALGLMTLIADRRGERLRDVMHEFGVAPSGAGNAGE